MTGAVIDDNFERIRGDLVSLGLTYDRLLDDVLDHICCMVEERMHGGDDFESSYGSVLQSIGENRLPELQHQTLLNLNKRFQKMKNFTYLFGLAMAIVSILGAYFKRMHWPAAGILLTLGIGLIILVFLPLYFITSHREQAGKKNPVYAVVGYFTLALALAGALFKMQHWPGAGSLLMAAVGFLVIGFVPLYVVNAFQRSGSQKTTLPYIVMLLVGIALVMVYSNVNMSKQLIDIYEFESIANEDQVDLAREKCTWMLDMTRDSADRSTWQKASAIHDEAQALQEMIDKMQEGMKAFVNQPGVPLEELAWKDNRRAGRKVIVNDELGKRFIDQAIAYREKVLEAVEDPITRSQIKDHLEFTGDVWPYEFGPIQVKDAPLMKNYFKNSDAAKGIALSEYVALSDLLDYRGGPRPQ